MWFYVLIISADLFRIWGFQSSGMSGCISWWVVPLKCQEPLTQWHIVTSQKTRILNCTVMKTIKQIFEIYWDKTSSKISVVKIFLINFLFRMVWNLEVLYCNYFQFTLEMELNGVPLLLVKPVMRYEIYTVVKIKTGLLCCATV